MLKYWSWKFKFGQVSQKMAGIGPRSGVYQAT